MTGRDKSGNVSRGYRCAWTHPNGEDRMLGELWPDRETAEHIAAMLRRYGMLDVQIRPWRERTGSTATASEESVLPE